MSSGKVTFVLPLKINANPLGSDLDRVRLILLPSIVRFFKISDIDQFLVVVPGNEHGLVTEALGEFAARLPLTILPEEDVLAMVPGWERHVRLHRSLDVLKRVDTKLTRGWMFRRLRLDKGWRQLSGWLKQQWLKLCAVRLVRTDFYMTLDADLCLTHAADVHALVPDGRAIMEYDAAGTHYDWWQGSAKMLGLPLKLSKTDLVLSVTPELMSSEVVRRLLAHLQIQAGREKYPTVFEYMAANPTWTEYTLYWLFLLEYYKPGNYYTDIKTKYPLHSDDSVWERENAADLSGLKARIGAAFGEGPAGALFIIMQSTCVSLQEYREAVHAYLS